MASSLWHLLACVLALLVHAQAPLFLRVAASNSTNTTVPTLPPAPLVSVISVGVCSIVGTSASAADAATYHGIRLGLAALRQRVYIDTNLVGNDYPLLEQAQLQLVNITCDGAASSATKAAVLSANRVIPLRVLVGGTAAADCRGMADAAAVLDIPYLPLCNSVSSTVLPLPVVQTPRFTLSADPQAETDAAAVPLGTVFRVLSSLQDEITSLVDWYLRVQWLLKSSSVSAIPTCFSFVHSDPSELGDDPWKILQDVIHTIGFTPSARMQFNPAGSPDVQTAAWTDFRQRAGDGCKVAGVQVHVVATVISEASSLAFLQSLTRPVNTTSTVTVLQQFNDEVGGAFQVLLNQHPMLLMSSADAGIVAQLDGVMGVTEVPGRFARVDLFQQAVLAYSSNIAPSFPPFVATAPLIASAYDCILLLGEALQSLLVHWQDRVPRWQLGWRFRAAVQSVRFMGATGAIRFRTDSAGRLGQRLIVRFGYLQFNAARRTLVRVATWSPDAGAETDSDLLERMHDSPFTSIFRRLFTQHDISSDYQTAFYYTVVTIADARSHGEPPPPRQRACTCASEVLNSVLFFGGVDDNGVAWSDTYQFDLIDQRYSLLWTSGPQPAGRFDASCFMVQRAFFVIGGMNRKGAFTDDLWLLDLNFMAWSIVAPTGSAQPRARAGSIPDPVWEGRLWFWGGNHAPTSYASIIVLDPQGYGIDGRVSTQLINGTPDTQVVDFSDQQFFLSTGYKGHALVVRERIPQWAPPYASPGCSASPPVVNCSFLTASSIEAQSLEPSVLLQVNIALDPFGAVIQRRNVTSPFLILMTLQGLPILFDAQLNTVRALPSICPIATLPSLSQAQMSGTAQIGSRLYVTISLPINPPPVNSSILFLNQIWSLNVDCDFDATASAACSTNRSGATGPLGDACGQWRHEDTFGLGERAMAVTNFGPVIIMQGGSTQTKQVANALYSFQTERNGTSAFTDGGRSGSGSNTFTLHTNRPVPAARQSHTAVRIGDQMLVWGGIRSTAHEQDVTAGAATEVTNELWSFDLTTFEWSLIAPTASTPHPRARHVAFVLRGNMYVITGISSQGEHVVSGQMYNPRSDSWTPLEHTPADKAPTARADAAVWTYDDAHAFVYGGMSNAGQPLAYLYSFNPLYPTCEAPPTGVAAPRLKTCRRSRWNLVTHAVSPLEDTLQESDMPPQCADAAVVFVDARYNGSLAIAQLNIGYIGTTFVFAGGLSSDTALLKTSYACDLLPNVKALGEFVCYWRRVASIPVDDRGIRYPMLQSATSVLLYPWVYITGGAMTGQHANSRILRFHVPTETWDDDGSVAFTERMASNSWMRAQPVVDGTAIAISNLWYVYGGATVGPAGFVQDDNLTPQIALFTGELPCSSHEYATTMSRNQSCSICTAGTVHEAVGDTCFSCPLGQYSGPLDPTCIPCPRGTFGPSLAASYLSDCLPCPVGTFSNVTGAVECQRCATGLCPLLSAAPLPMSFDELLKSYTEVASIDHLSTTLTRSNYVRVEGLEASISLATGGLIALFVFAYIAAWIAGRPIRFRKMDQLFRTFHASVLRKGYYLNLGFAPDKFEREMGSVVYERPTAMGGLFTITATTLILSLLVQLSLTYALNNVRERFQLVPNASVGDDVRNVTGDFNLVVEFVYLNSTSEYFDEPPCSPHHVRVDVQGVSSTSFVSLDAPGLTSATELSVANSTGILNLCQVSYSCPACYFTSPLANISVRLLSPGAYAFALFATTTSSAAYPDQHSTARQPYLALPLGATILQGLAVPTTVAVDATAIIYRDSVKGAVTGDSVKDVRAVTGYQLTPGVDGIQAGSSADNTTAFQDQGLWVRFDFVVDASTLEIMHEPVQSIPQFLASLLAVSGVIAAMGAVLIGLEGGEDVMLRKMARRWPSVAKVAQSAAENLLANLRATDTHVTVEMTNKRMAMSANSHPVSGAAAAAPASVSPPPAVGSDSAVIRDRKLSSFSVMRRPMAKPAARAVEGSEGSPAAQPEEL